jgi:hypothetical protein
MSRASSLSERRVLAISSSRRRYQCQESNTSPEETKKARPMRPSSPRLLHHPSSTSAAPSKARTAAATTVSVRETAGDTVSEPADGAEP